MKHAMTPRVPQLHNRTLSGNIFDQSLGILHDRGVTPDSEHAHLDIIGKEVSIWQEDSESNLQQFGRERQRHPSSDSGVASGEARTMEEATEVVTSPEKFADDPPGIGMEVVCEDGTDPSDEIESSSVLPIHNGVINGLKGTPANFTLINHHQRAGEGDKSTTEDSDGEVHKEIMKIFQNARYDLRFPVQRYSNQASSRCKTSKTPPVSSEEQLSTGELIKAWFHLISTQPSTVHNLQLFSWGERGINPPRILFPRAFRWAQVCFPNLFAC